MTFPLLKGKGVNIVPPVTCESARGLCRAHWWSSSEAIWYRDRHTTGGDWKTWEHDFFYLFTLNARKGKNFSLSAAAGTWIQWPRSSHLCAFCVPLTCKIMTALRGWKNTALNPLVNSLQCPQCRVLTGLHFWDFQKDAVLWAQSIKAREASKSQRSFICAEPYHCGIG